MHTNISNYYVIYDGTVLNAIEMDMRFGNDDLPITGDIGKWTPEFLIITALDANNQIVVIGDNAKKFQFVRKI